MEKETTCILMKLITRARRTYQQLTEKTLLNPSLVLRKSKITLSPIFIFRIRRIL